MFWIKIHAVCPENKTERKAMRLIENETSFSFLQLFLDVTGIVRDRQEPCTCETYNGQVGPSSYYNKEAPDSVGQVPNKD